MIGLVAGLLVLGRHLLEPVVSARVLVDAFGVSAVLTGTLRLAGAFEVERRTGRWWTFGGLPLGSVEIMLGAIVLIAGSGNLRLVTAAVGAWGLIGGTLLLAGGLQDPPIPPANSLVLRDAVRKIGHLLSDPGASFRDPGPGFHATRIGPGHANAGTSASSKPRLQSSLSNPPPDQPPHLLAANAPGGLRAAGRR